MGGFGSGRPSSGAPTCEGCLNIDLAWLRRRGMLTPGRFSTLTWSRVGEQTGSIRLVAQQRRRAPDVPDEGSRRGTDRRQ